jgi:membrane protease YdiL (CAAX protease family)
MLPDTVSPPPFPAGLAPGAAWRQAAALLVLFYTVVYGVPLVMGDLRERMALPALSALVLGTLMLVAVLLFVRRDRSWQASVGLEPYPVPAALKWGLLGFVGTYAVNVLLTTVYVTVRGDLEGVAARRAEWLGILADLPVELILPLAAFVAIWEETVFRGFLLGRLRAALPADESRNSRLRRDVVAVAITALLFGAGHAYQGVLGVAQTTVAGVALGTLAVWRGSVWPAVAAHLAIDAFGLLLLQALKSALPRAAG